MLLDDKKRVDKTYDVTVFRDARMTLSDGVSLAADVYVPATPDIDRSVEAAQWPVILERTPYDKANPILVQTARYFAERGLAVVIQDVRGRFASEGTYYRHRFEGPDGFDTVAWVRQQFWCDGRVATIGLSYSSCTQTSLGALAPEGLAGQFIAQGMSSSFREGVRNGGTFEVKQVFGMFQTALADAQARGTDPIAQRALAYGRRQGIQWLENSKLSPMRKGESPLRFAPSQENWLLDVMTESTFSDYWRTPGCSPELYYDQHADVPIFYLGGWYDWFAPATCRNFVAMRERKSSPVRMIIGHWTHGADKIGQRYSGDVDFGTASAIDYDDLRVKWFQEVLQGEPHGLIDGPPIRLFVMGGGSGRRLPNGKLDHGGGWRAEQEWPLARTSWSTYYLHGEGTLRESTPAEGPELTTYRFDPSRPVPTIGGAIVAYFTRTVDDIGTQDYSGGTPPGGQDQRARPDWFGCSNDLPLASRPDVISFSTEPLTQPLEVTGPIEVVLYVQSDCPDTDFNAKLVDVYPANHDYPDGYALILCDGVRRMRYRNGFEREELMEPGEIYELRFEIPPTSNLFEVGHCIRVDVSSSNFPRFDVNPNTGEPLGRHRGVRVATNSLHHSEERPSHVILPVIPRRGA